MISLNLIYTYFKARFMKKRKFDLFNTHRVITNFPSEMGPTGKICPNMIGATNVGKFAC